MRRVRFLLIAIAATMLIITTMATSRFYDDNKHPSHHHVSMQRPQARVDGETNPDLIPDSAAYEILFRLLSSSNMAEKKREERKSAYLRVAGFTSPEVAAIANAAYEYNRQIEPLDTEVDSIKHANWPTPSLQVMNQLTQLQRQKEMIIEIIAGGLQGQTNRYSPIRLRNHINEIKRKTKGFNTSLPTKKVGMLESLFSDLFTVSAQGAGCDALVYLYNNVTVDWDYMIVYGSGSYSMPYNNCGHTITLATSLSGPLGTYETGGDGTYLSLQYGGSWLDGYFFSTTEAESYCPVVQESYYAGSMSDNETLGAWVRLKSGSTSPSHITGTQGSGAATFTVQMDVSISANGKTIFISPGASIESGNLTVGDLSTDPGENSTVTIGGTSFTIQFSANTTERAGVIRPSVEAYSGSADVRPSGGPGHIASSNTITVNNTW